MGIDWKDLAGQVIGLGAPLLGQALAGPFGAAAGRILADALGAPDATAGAVKSVMTDASAEHVQRAEADWIAALSEVGKAQVSEVGATQRAEIGAGDAMQRWWRPLYALELSLLECPAFALTLLRALWIGHEAGIRGFAELSGLLMTYFAARFGVLGIYVTGRSREKQVALTGAAAPSLVEQVADAIAKRKAK